jgi:predicted transcriptional regulator
MTQQTATVDVETFDAFKSRTLEGAREIDRTGAISSGVHLSFANLELLLRVLTPKRCAALRALRQEGPMSVRALAGLVGRDYKAVHSDVAALIEDGLVTREAKDRVAVYWDHVQADLKLAA